MISDQIILGNSTAYLRNENDSVNLAESSTSSPVRTPKLAANQIWHVSGLELLIEAGDLEPLIHLPDTLENPLLEINVQKEVFPMLYANPYQTRVHNIAGFKDFESGKSTNCFVSEVNDIPTLVSMGTDECRWESVVYKLPTKIELFAASWELAISRLVIADQFEYSIQLLIWQDHNTNRVADHQIDLAQNKDANDKRLHYLKPSDQLVGCHAFQLKFTATVNVDSTFYESHRLDFSNARNASLQASESIGIPLLRSIRLLEKVESDFSFFSLNEIIQRAEFHQVFNPAADEFYRLLARLDISTVLVGGDHVINSTTDDYEFLEIKILASEFSRVQAKLNLSERITTDHF